MADREKVIAHFQDTVETFGDTNTWRFVRVDILKDAIALLEAQEPMVMDADEIVLSAEPSKWLWVERKGDYCAEAYKAGKTVSGLIAFDCETPNAFLFCERPDEYGKTWRCWTSRPDDKRRYETPWES
jgi:hypothetical protein